MTKICIICGDETKHPSYDFCEKCFSSTIEEIEERYSKERASETREDHQETPSASEPLTENTHH